MDKLTQEDVDKAFVEIKNLWDSKVEESGKTEKMFIITDDTGFVSKFLAYYQDAKEFVEGEGLRMPFLVEGLTVKVTEE